MAISGQVLEETGMGFDKEVEMIRLASKNGAVFDCVRSHPPRCPANGESRCRCYHCPRKAPLLVALLAWLTASCSLDEAIERTQEIIDAAREISPDAFFLTHGGPINTPDDVRVMLERTTAHGFVGRFIAGASWAWNSH